MLATLHHAGAPLDETDLVRQAATGDTSAFEALYRSNSGRIYALCLRMTANPAIAEEMAQDAFMRAWQKLPTFRGDAAFSTWLHRLTVNVVLSHRRTAARRRERMNTADELTTVDEPTQVRPGRSMDLEQAIAALPEGARKIFVLYNIEGYRHQEIASIAGVAVGTSKAQLHRARRLLRKHLQTLPETAQHSTKEDPHPRSQS